MIAGRMAKIDASGIRKVFDLAAKLKNPVDFSIGQPDFDVPENIKQAACEAIRQGKNKYTVTQGIEELRLKVAATIKDEYDWEPGGILITSGVSGALVLVLLVMVDEGDEVLIGDPYFVMYKHLVNLAGGVPVFVDTYPDFHMTAERIQRHITKRTKLLILNSPCNPTGAVNPPQDMKDIAHLADEKNLFVITDEIYKTFCYEGKYPSVVPHMKENVLLVTGFSKSHAFTGWRLGYAAGDKKVIEEMTKLQQYSFVCAPSMVQWAGLVALETETRSHVETYRRRRDLVYNGLKDNFEVQKPGGAFYIFPKVPEGRTDMEFCEEAIKNNLLIIPGSVFSEKPSHFRIAFATSDDNIAKGLEILNRLAG